MSLGNVLISNYIYDIRYFEISNYVISEIKRWYIRELKAKKEENILERKYFRKLMSKKLDVKFANLKSSYESRLPHAVN